MKVQLKYIKTTKSKPIEIATNNPKEAIAIARAEFEKLGHSGFHWICSPAIMPPSEIQYVLFSEDGKPLAPNIHWGNS